MHTTTIWQPWASLIAIGAKPFETRAYPPPRKLIGQRIAIHAAAKVPSALIDGMGSDVIEAIADALEAGGHRGPPGYGICWHGLPCGAVICTAVLAGAYQCGETIGQIGDDAHFEVAQRFPGSPCSNTYLPIDPFGDYSPGRWAWHLTDVQRLPEPLPAKGKQGWWMWGPPAREVV